MSVYICKKCKNVVNFMCSCGAVHYETPICECNEDTLTVSCELIPITLNSVNEKGLTQAKAIVIINEQHSLLPDQESKLEEKYGDSWGIHKIPAAGYCLQDMMIITKGLTKYMEEGIDIVFVSPVPVMLAKLSKVSSKTKGKVFVFHNDKREKKELPNGKIIMTVAKDGWKLVEV